MSVFGHMAGVRGGSPAATNVQVPGAEMVLQDLQVSLQAVLQQTPSTQNPVSQSLSQPQAVPLVFLVDASCVQATASTPPSWWAGFPEEE